MMITPQDLVVIGGLVSTMVQLTKQALPGDWNEWGVEITGLISLVAVAAWLASQPGTLGQKDAFDILTLWVGVFSTATGIYKTAKMATDGGGRTVAKLREARRIKAEEALPNG